VSAVFWDGNFDDIHECAKDGPSTLYEFYYYLYGTDTLLCNVLSSVV